jgi:carboxypeptidase C (cathepsin A)
MENLVERKTPASNPLSCQRRDRQSAVKMRVSTLAAFALPCLAAALPATTKDRRYAEVHEGTNYTVFEHAATSAKLSFVTNSGICETTPGVNQYSGYLSVGDNMNMWFWFFESRSSPSTAPLAMWLNGGPGCSSMIGMT